MRIIISDENGLDIEELKNMTFDPLAGKSKVSIQKGYGQFIDYTLVDSEVFIRNGKVSSIEYTVVEIVE